MKPSQVTDILNRIATYIDNTKAPNRTKIAQKLHEILATFNDEDYGDDDTRYNDQKAKDIAKAHRVVVKKLLTDMNEYIQVFNNLKRAYPRDKKVHDLADRNIADAKRRLDDFNVWQEDLDSIVDSKLVYGPMVD